MKLSVVMPVYNEVGTIDEVVAAVQSVPVDKQIIVVDDGSHDGTRSRLSRLEEAGSIRVILHEHNQGKGAALQTGFKAADGDLVIIQDADLEYDPSEYPRLMQPILAGDADVVYGSRFLNGNGKRSALRYWHAQGNRVLTALSNVFTRLRLTDMETCYKLFRRDVLNDLVIEERGFGVEPEITAKIARAGWRVREVAISYRGRSYHEGKKISWRDGVWAIWCIVKYGRR